MTLTVTLCLVAFVLGIACADVLDLTKQRTRHAEDHRARETRRQWSDRHRAQQKAHDRLQMFRSRQQGGTPAA